MSSRIATLLFVVTACSSTVHTPTGTARVRVAHLSPDAPNVDFCVAPHGTADFTGPILATNGHLTGLPYGNATKYFELQRGSKENSVLPDVRVEMASRDFFAGRDPVLAAVAAYKR